MRVKGIFLSFNLIAKHIPEKPAPIIITFGLFVVGIVVGIDGEKNSIGFFRKKIWYEKYAQTIIIVMTIAN